MCELFTEIVCVCLDSVMAIQFSRYDGGEHFALDAGKRGFSKHDGAVEIDADFEDTRVEAHNVDDVPDAASALHGSIKLLLEKASGFIDRDLFNPGHCGKWEQDPQGYINIDSQIVA